MKKSILLAMVMMLVMPLFAQKLSKEEKAAIAKAKNEAAMAAINSKAWVLVPSSYTQKDGMIASNIDNSEFISCEGDYMYAQGRIVCDNSYTNQLTPTAYEPKLDKKGNLRFSITVSGRMMRGSYTISMRGNTDNADVIFTPNKGDAKRFSGKIVPLKQAS
ncbi:MAG: hypothetical protein Q4B21_01380, partial [Bacteroidia bacterium]|nr:hypothetical protein [Bacteroidia bacterium]